MNTVVYQHRRLDTNEVFYVGIGKPSRPTIKCGKTKLWKNIVNKAGYSVEIILRNQSWEEAVEVERYLIKYYGRRDLGLGNLVNMTDGGDGCSNPSKETLYKGKNRQRRWNISKDELFKIYIEEGLTRKNIAMLHNITESLVKVYLSRFNIKKIK